jgi:hypothetical protein
VQDALIDEETKDGIFDLISEATNAAKKQRLGGLEDDMAALAIRRKLYCHHCKESLSGKKQACMCSRCKTAVYCNAICQVNDWQLHKQICKSL